jgi:small subunit ribosomal protein S1
MDQTDAQSGQEEAPEGQIPEGQTPAKAPEERPATSTRSMEKLLQEEGLNLDFPKQGEIRTGVVASIGENEILVSVGTKSEGVISGKEKEQIPAEVMEDLQIGQEIPVYVLNPEDSNGNLVLSYMRAREESDWVEAEKMKESGVVNDAEVIGYNKGGLLVPIGMLRGFVPASQVSVLRRSESEESADARWSKMVGEPIKVVVIEVDRVRHRLILSERVALQETRETIKDRLLDELEEGDIRTGRVTSLADFGAFVNIDGADGLVHLSEISWERIDHPSEVLKVGQEVQVKVITVDQERKRIGLSIRQLLPDPWVLKISHLKEGQLVEGTITHLTKFGAFARLDEDLEGLIHISELSDQRINHPKEVVKEGDVVTLRIIKIDPERRRIGLSLRKVDSLAYANLDYEMMLSQQKEEEKTEEAPPQAEQPAKAEEKVETAPQAEEAAQVEMEQEAEAEPQAEKAAEAETEPQVEEAAETTEQPEAEAESQTEAAAQAEEVIEAEEAAEAEAEPQVEEATETTEQPEAGAESQTEATAQAEEAVEAEETPEAEAEPQSEEVADTTEQPEAGTEPQTEAAAQAEEVVEAEETPEAEAQPQSEEVTDTTGQPEAGTEPQTEAATQAEEVIEAELPPVEDVQDVEAPAETEAPPPAEAEQEDKPAGEEELE